MTSHQNPRVSVLLALAAPVCLILALLMFALWARSRAMMQAMASEKQALSLRLAAQAQQDLKARSGPSSVAQFGGGFPPPDQDGWRTLFGPGTVIGWQPISWQPQAPAPDRSIVDGCICISDGRAVYGDEVGDVIIRVQVRKISGQNVSLRVRHSPDGDYGAWFNGGDFFGIGKKLKDMPFTDLTARNLGRSFDGFFEMKLSAIKDTLVLYANGEEVVRAQDQSLRRGRIGLGAFGGMGIFKDVQVQILDEQR